MKKDVNICSRTNKRVTTCEKCGGGNILRSAKSLNMTESDRFLSSYSSSYPSSCSSYLPFFLDNSFDSKSFSSTCCNRSSDDSCLTSVTSSFDNLRLDKSSSCCVSCDGESVRSWKHLKPQDRAVRHLCHSFSSNEDDSSTESDSETCSSEMGWSFGNFWEVQNGKSTLKPVEQRLSESKTRKSNSFGRGITPFVTNSNRTMDVLEKFGEIVSSLKKPGHHVGPSKNADCLCDNCRTFFATK